MVHYQDTFQRANQAGLGTASQGQVWSSLTSGGTMTGSIVSNQGNLVGINSDTVFALGTSTATNVEMILRILCTSYTTEAIGPVCRVQDTFNWYRPRLVNGSLDLTKLVANSITVFATVAFTLTNSTAYWIRYRVQGTTHSVKAWQSGTAEPNAWNIIATDSTFTTAGRFGIEAWQSAANTLIVDSFNCNVLPMPIISAYRQRRGVTS